MLRLVSVLICNFVRYIYCRLLYGKRYKSNIIERISNRASITLFSKGTIDIGRNIELAPFVDVQVHGNGSCKIGDLTYMNRYCMISCHGKVTIGNNCMFGPGVRIFDNNHRFSKDKGVSADLKIGEITIGNNCWIASNVILLKGAEIGDNCVIGAGCIIDRNIPANSLVRNSQQLIIDSLK